MKNKFVFMLMVFLVVLLIMSSSANAEGETICTYDWECDFLSDACHYGECDSGNCVVVLNDTEGPVVSDIMVDPNPNNGLFSVSALAVDACSNVENASFHIDNECEEDPVKMDAVDGLYDELEEEVGKEDNDLVLSDGGHDLWVIAKDSEENYGECTGISFEVDTLPPELESKEITEYDFVEVEGNDTLYWICGDDSILEAEVCDVESILDMVEYLVDEFDVPLGDGYLMSPVDGDFDEVCEDLTAAIENEEFDEGKHALKVRGKDKAGNWGKVLNTQNASYFIIDRTAPETEKELDGEKVECDVENDGENDLDACWHITQDTVISLSCEDVDNGEGYYSDDVSLYYRTRYKYDLNDTWNNWSEWSSYNESFSFDEDSVHEVEYYCSDLCLNEEDHHFELDIVDTQAPETDRDIFGPQHGCELEEGCDWYANGYTEVNLTCNDLDPHPVGETTLYWREYANGTTYNFSREVGGWARFSFDEEGVRNVDYYCVDGLGNEGDVVSEVFFVENGAPVVNKTVGEPKIECEGDCDWWITQDTEISFECVDEGDYAVDHEETYYRYSVDYGNWSNWTLYLEPFSFDEDGVTDLEYYCEDALENSLGVFTERDNVDSTSPVTEKTVMEPKYFKNDSFDWWITQDTEICLNASDLGIGDFATYYRYSVDGGNYTNWTSYVDCFSFEEDSNHTLEYYSIDTLDNMEELQTEMDSVDSAAPDLNKSVVVDGEEMFEFGYANNESNVSICAYAPDVKLTGDEGVGTDPDSVSAGLSGTGWGAGFPLSEVDEDYYCAPWEPLGCDSVQVSASASDYLGNNVTENGMLVIVDNGLAEGSVFNPHSGEYYHDGKMFTVFAPAVDEVEENTTCEVSGVNECRFYALQFCYECVNDNRSQLVGQEDIIGFLDELNESYELVYLGETEYDGHNCVGTLEVPDDSGLTDTVFMTMEIEDKAGNVRHRLAINALWDPITMNMDNEGPQVTIVDGLNGTYTSEDFVSLTAEVVDYESQPDTCRLDLYSYSGNESELLIEGLVWSDVVDYECTLSAEIPKYVDNELLGDGDYKFEVVAIDNEDNVGSDWMGFMLDNSKPYMGVVSPLAGDVFGEVFLVSLHLNDSMSLVVEESARFRFLEPGNIGNLWCLLGCMDTGWLDLDYYEDDLYVGGVNTTEHNFTDGNYNFDAVVCDEFYITDDSPLGFDMNLDRNTMHCRQISEHGADEEPRMECNDGLDNDWDGFVDLLDPGCESSEDDDEGDA